MKRIIFSVVFMVLIISSTSTFANTTYNWTGPYLGLQGMYAHGDTKWEYTSNFARADHTINGWMGGLFLGYNYQFPVNVVVGVETDFNYGKILGSASAPNPNYSVNTDANWLGSTRLRAGYAFWRFLPYAAIGIAYGRADIYTTHIPTSVDYSEANTYFGWTPSIGLDFAITKNLKARAEYSYYDLGKKQSLVDSAIPVESTITFQGFKFGLYWTFGGAKETTQPIAKEVVPEPAPAPAPPPPAPAPIPPPPPPPVEEMKKAPEAAAVVEQTMIEKGRVTMNVEFDTGKAIVKPAYYKEIEGVADVLKKYPELKIVVEGHTDNIGGEKYNLKLSQKRAEAIKEVMVKNFQIESSRVTAKGFGYSNSIGDNKTKAGRQSNRRVEAAVEYEYKVKK